jgi:hypothetical protein
MLPAPARAAEPFPMNDVPPPIDLGSWTIFSDIAGQVSERVDNPIVTIAAVAVARADIGEARRQLVAGFGGQPRKWRDGRVTGFANIARVATDFQIRTAAWQLYRQSEQWRQFYEQAQVFHEEATSRSGERLTFLKGDDSMRMFLFIRASDHLVGNLLKARYPWAPAAATIDIEYVVDSDFKTCETRALFQWATTQWAETTALRRLLGVVPRARAYVETEEEEPLLLLPDYIAGVFHHADTRTRLGLPVVPPAVARGLVDTLRRALGKRLYEVAEDFNQQYPLAHDGPTGNTPRGPHTHGDLT